MRNYHGPPPPPPPPPPSGCGPRFIPPLREQVNSTRVIDITPRTLLDAPTSRMNLTSYSLYTIKKTVPTNPREKSTWARAEVVEEKLVRSEIISRIRKLNGGRESVGEKKASLQPFQQGQISSLLDDLATREHDPNFEYSLVQLDIKKRLISKVPKKMETVSMSIYVSRTPLEGLDPIILEHNIERNRIERLQAQKRSPTQDQQPPRLQPQQQERAGGRNRRRASRRHRDERPSSSWGYDADSSSDSDSGSDSDSDFSSSSATYGKIAGSTGHGPAVKEHPQAEWIEAAKRDQNLKEIPVTKQCATPLCSKAPVGLNSLVESNYCDLHKFIAKDGLEDTSANEHSNPKLPEGLGHMNEQSTPAAPLSPPVADESLKNSSTAPIARDHSRDEIYGSDDSATVHPIEIFQPETFAEKPPPDVSPNRRPRNINSSKEIMATANSTYEKVIKNGRKILRVTLKGVEHIACPDSGSDKNIISKEFAKEHNFRIRCGKKDIKRFELGSGAYIESIGRARLPCSLAKGSGSCRKQWFHVLADSIVPLIMGRHFLEQTQVLTKNRHLLERCPPELRFIPSLKFIGSPRKRSGMGVSINGRVLVATPDTGSDLNLISLACAERERFYIDKGQEGLVRLQNADGSVTKTMGRVYVASLSLDLRMSQNVSERQQPDYDAEESAVTTDIPDLPLDCDEPADDAGEVFYVVKGLACDVILGNDFLERSNAFNIGTKMFTGIPASERDHFGLKIFKILGPWQSRFSKAKIKPPDVTVAEIARREHDDDYRKERFRRSKAKRRIGELVGAQQTDAWSLELAAIEAFNKQHNTCIHCHYTRL
ncbi:hypothetical protein G7Y89_g14452 [Cudoniella acicularis]|uniref:Uncharacterized protein n=1 Tax=Cudoniella acicularis TaxID=354080 RepID=A0A8H4R2Y4_9HELO|nr:hypothetical protein G7Y89_g14452 [Cudoniella acicularis]